MPLDNFIYYDHRNTGVFNWRDYASKNDIVTQEQFDRFLKKVDYSKLPSGIEFQLKSACHDTGTIHSGMRMRSDDRNIRERRK